MRRAERSLGGVLLTLGLAGCDREPAPEVAAGPPSGLPVEIVRTSELLAGPPRAQAAMANPYEGDRTATAEGRRYYTWFNCAGCHGGAGGGGIGPPFADEDWIYGGEPANVFQSIVQGRPNGMPSFGGQIPTEQVWKLVAFVRSLGDAGGGGAE